MPSTEKDEIIESTSPARRDSTYEWTDDGCAMCESQGPWPALEKTRDQSGDRWNIIHHYLHGTIGPQRASRISANVEAVHDLAALRKSKRYSNNDSVPGEGQEGDEAVQRWAEATGLIQETVLYSRVEHMNRLSGSGFSDLVRSEVYDQIQADQKEYEQRLSTFVSKAMINGELETARKMQAGVKDQSSPGEEV